MEQPLAWRCSRFNPQRDCKAGVNLCAVLQSLPHLHTLVLTDMRILVEWEGYSIDVLKQLKSLHIKWDAGRNLPIQQMISFLQQCGDHSIRLHELAVEVAAVNDVML